MLQEVRRSEQAATPKEVTVAAGPARGRMTLFEHVGRVWLVVFGEEIGVGVKDSRTRVPPQSGIVVVWRADGVGAFVVRHRLVQPLSRAAATHATV